MLNVLEVVKKTSEFFASKGVESPRLNAELLVSHALALGRMQLYLQFERPVSEAELAAIRELVRRRGRREPLQYVIGFTDFCGLRLKTDRRALIPRPETEFLVETLIARCEAPPARILDLGTGSGAIALALARAFPLASVTASDSSRDALALAEENAALAGLAGGSHGSSRIGSAGFRPDRSTWSSQTRPTFRSPRSRPPPPRFATTSRRGPWFPETGVFPTSEGSSAGRPHTWRRGGSWPSRPERATTASRRRRRQGPASRGPSR